MKIAKSALVFGTHSSLYSSSNLEWQGKKNPHAEQGTGKDNQYMFSVLQTVNEFYEGI